MVFSVLLTEARLARKERHSPSAVAKLYDSNGELRASLQTVDWT